MDLVQIPKFVLSSPLFHVVESVGAQDRFTRHAWAVHDLLSYLLLAMTLCFHWVTRPINKGVCSKRSRMAETSGDVISFFFS